MTDTALIYLVLTDLKAELNRLDTSAGEGDTGATFSSGALTVLQVLKNKKLPLAKIEQLFEVIGEHLVMSMGGSSYAKQQQLAEVWLSGLEQMNLFGCKKVGDRTIIFATL